MNLLDENIVDSQWQCLQRWRVPIRKIGRGVGRKGITDQAIIPLLHQLGRVTFLTRDADFYRRDLCHPGYCLVCLSVDQSEVASFVRRFLRHPQFNTRAKRMGKVVRVAHSGMRVWRLHAQVEQAIGWSSEAS